MSLWHRLACLSLLVSSVLALQSGASLDGARGFVHRVFPLVRLASILPSGGSDQGAADPAEVERLRLELLSRESEIRSLRERVDALTAFRGRYPDRFRVVVPAEIVFRRDPFPFRHTIYLDRGEVDGVAIGDAVVWGEALVGQVFRVHRSVCQVRLVTDPMLRVPALVVEPTTAEGAPNLAFRQVGVMVGNSEPSCRLDFVPWTTRLEVGMHLVTSGFGGEIPRQLVLGRVVSVANNQSAPFLDVEVEPAVDVDHLTQVLVVRREAVRVEPEDE